MSKRIPNLFNFDENNPYFIDFMKKYAEQRESFKFIRMTEDIQHMSNYLNDIRICFIAITITIYIVLISWFIYFCVRRNRRNVNGGQRRPRSQWDYQGENQNPGQTDDLVSVRSDGQVGMTAISATPAPYTMSRNHRGPTPSFMRHGLQMNHAQQTTRLVADSSEGTVKHQISSSNPNPITTTSSNTTNNNPSNNNIGFTLQNLPTKHSEIINGNGIITGATNDTIIPAITTTTSTNNGRNIDRTITSGGGERSSRHHKEAISDM
uniref:Uncharacterized protein n=1 Tax=Panagrolaimus sp. ES5 TaxID=591445 RepID=A0AC34F2T6_9BILA